MPDWGPACETPTQRSSFNNINYLELSITTTKKIILIPLAANSGGAGGGKGFYLHISEKSLVFDQSGCFFFFLPSLYVLNFID